MSGGQLVLAAVDGSESARQAALWAAEDAALRSAELRLVEVIADPAGDPREHARLDHVAHRCRRAQPEVPVRDLVAHGHPAAELVRFSREADLLVVGSRGRGTGRRAGLGSVAVRVATHAACPVAVVRAPRSTGSVVAGVDGSEQGRRALHFAFAAARARKTDLVAVRARDLAQLGRFAAVPPPDFEVQAELDHARRELDRALGEWDELYPDVAVRREVRCGHPAAVLLHRAARARLLAVGHRGTGGFAGLLLGSTAAGVLRDPPCPVAVLRGAEPPRR